jgi:hypothetical protein
MPLPTRLIDNRRSYRVVFTFEAEADTPYDAALEALATIFSRRTATHFYVTDKATGDTESVDVFEEKEFFTNSIDRIRRTA